MSYYNEYYFVMNCEGSEFARKSYFSHYNPIMKGFNRYFKKMDMSLESYVKFLDLLEEIREIYGEWEARRKHKAHQRIMSEIVYNAVEKFPKDICVLIASYL